MPASDRKICKCMTLVLTEFAPNFTSIGESAIRPNKFLKNTRF